MDNVEFIGKQPFFSFPLWHVQLALPWRLQEKYFTRRY